MFNPLDYPRLIFVLALPSLWISTWMGVWVHRRQKLAKDYNREDLGFIVGGTLTLLGLIIGFTFSMAVDRYNQRKNYEEQEANAIGTEYVRAGLLPTTNMGKVRELLKSYVDERILWYKCRDERLLGQIDVKTAHLQDELWSATAAPLTGQSTAVAALIIGGMNDVLNSQGYTQASWWNRIPIAAWMLVATISIFSNWVIGYASQGRSSILFMILPIVLSIALFLIVDIDSPRHGLIQVRPQNLESVAHSINSR